MKVKFNYFFLALLFVTQPLSLKAQVSSEEFEDIVDIVESTPEGARELKKEIRQIEKTMFFNKRANEVGCLRDFKKERNKKAVKLALISTVGVLAVPAAFLVAGPLSLSLAPNALWAGMVASTYAGAGAASLATLAEISPISQLIQANRMTHLLEESRAHKIGDATKRFLKTLKRRDPELAKNWNEEELQRRVRDLDQVKALCSGNLKLQAARTKLGAKRLKYKITTASELRAALRSNFAPTGSAGAGRLTPNLRIFSGDADEKLVIQAQIVQYISRSGSLIDVYELEPGAVGYFEHAPSKNIRPVLTKDVLEKQGPLEIFKATAAPNERMRPELNAIHTRYQDALRRAPNDLPNGLREAKLEKDTLKKLSRLAISLLAPRPSEPDQCPLIDWFNSWIGDHKNGLYAPCVGGSSVFVAKASGKGIKAHMYSTPEYLPSGVTHVYVGEAKRLTATSHNKWFYTAFLYSNEQYFSWNVTLAAALHLKVISLSTQEAGTFDHAVGTNW